MDGVLVELAEVAGAVDVDEEVEHFALGVGAGIGTGFFEIGHDAGDGAGVESADAVNVFGELAVIVAFKPAVHAHHDGSRVLCGFALQIEFFGFGLGDAGCVVVAGGGEHKVVAVFLVHAHGHDGRVEDDGEEFAAHFVEGLSVEGQGTGGYGLECFAEVVLREVGKELLAAVVVVDAGGEPHALEVDGEGLEEFVGTFSAVVFIHGFEECTDAEVVTSVLVEKDVAAFKGGFLEIVDEGFFLEGEFLETFHFVAEHLDVGELLVGIFETVGSALRLCRSGSAERGDCGNHECGDFVFHTDNALKNEEWTGLGTTIL